MSFRRSSRSSITQAEAGAEKEGERGWALVSVLCVVSMLALMAAATQELTLTSSRAEHAATGLADANADLDAGLARAIVGIDDQRPAARWRIDGVPHAFSFDGARMRIAIQDELGRIDLNAADESMIRRLLQSAGLDLDAANALTDKILDWRSASDLARLHGATSADYAAARYAWHPRHGPFQSIDELKLVMGVTPALFARIRPALTVYTGKPAFDPNVAPREALAALYLDSQDKADDLLKARTRPVDDGGSATAGLWNPALSLAGRAFTVTIDMTWADRRYHREAVILLTGDDKQPYLMLAWK